MGSKYSWTTLLWYVKLQPAFFTQFNLLNRIFKENERRGTREAWYIHDLADWGQIVCIERMLPGGCERRLAYPREFGDGAIIHSNLQVLRLIGQEKWSSHCTSEDIKFTDNLR